MAEESINKLYDNKDLDRLGPMSLDSGPISGLLRELRDLEASRAHVLLWTRARWMREGLPITWLNSSAKKLPDGTIEFTAKGKVSPSNAKVPDLTGKKAVLLPSTEKLDEEIEKCIAPFYTIRGAINILQIILGIPDNDPKRKEERYLTFFKRLGETIPSPRKFGS